MNKKTKPTAKGGMKMTMEKIIPVLAVVFAALVSLQPAQAAATDYSYLVEITGTSFLPATIYPGDVVSFAVDVKDRGTVYSIIDMNGTLDVGNQFEAVDVEDNIALIQKGSTKTLVFRFRAKEDTLPGYYPAFLTMTYSRAGEVVTETQSITIPVSEPEKKNLDVTISPRVINPGNQTEVVFTLKNVGGNPVSNISFSWAEAGNLVMPIGSDNKRHIAVLQPNQVADVSYTVAADPNITPGIYPLDITMTFSDVGGTKTQSSQVGLIVGGTTDFEIGAELTTTGQVSISIANVGSNNAGAVVVRVPEQAGISVNGSSTAILGNLNRGDFTIATFAIRSSALRAGSSAAASGFGTPGAWQGRPQEGAYADQNFSSGQEGGGAADTGTRTVLVQIDYTDTTGERQSIKKEIQMSLTVSETAGTMAAGRGRQDDSSSLIPWALLVLVAGGAAAFNRFRAGNSNWKKLAKLLAVVLVMFLAVIFLLGSNLVAAAGAAVVSIALLVSFFRKGFVFSSLDRLKLPQKGNSG